MTIFRDVQVSVRDLSLKAYIGSVASSSEVAWCPISVALDLVLVLSGVHGHNYSEKHLDLESFLSGMVQANKDDTGCDAASDARWKSFQTVRVTADALR